MDLSYFLCYLKTGGVPLQRFDNVYQKAMQYVFGDSLLCDTLELAKTLCYRNNEKVKAVSLDGTIIHKSGLMTGGTSDIAARAKRWEEKDVEGWLAFFFLFFPSLLFLVELTPIFHVFKVIRRTRERLNTDLLDVERQLKKAQDDTQVVNEIALLEDNIRTIKTDLVCLFLFVFVCCIMTIWGFCPKKTGHQRAEADGTRARDP